MPSASTPTTQRVPRSSACAIPISAYVSSPRFPLTGVQRSSEKSARSAHVGTNGALALHDLARYRFDQTFDALGLRVARQDVQRRLFQEFGEARHMHAGFIRRQVGHHRELAVIDPFAPVDFQMHDAAHARNADAVERQAYVRRFVLTIGGEVQAALAFANRPVRGCGDECGRDFGQRDRVVRTRCEVVAHQPSVRGQKIDIDRTRREFANARAADRELDVARKALERRSIEFRLQVSRDVQKRRAIRSAGRLRFIERRNGDDARTRAQPLQRRQDVPLTIAEVRTDSDVKVAHAGLSAKRRSPSVRSARRRAAGRIRRTRAPAGRRRNMKGRRR